MNLDDQIRQINNQQEFVEICNTVLTAKYPGDFQVIDGTRSDDGNDGYISSERHIFAIYCPSKPENRTDRDYESKIYSDLEKAKKLHEVGKLVIENWTFITPGKLSNNVIVNLMKKAKEYGFKGNHLESTFLANELYKNQSLLNKFPGLHIPRIESKLDEIISKLDELKKPHKEGVEIAIEKKEYAASNLHREESKDLKRVFEILRADQTETSKSELKSIFYLTTDKVAQINIILGLLKWNDPLEDKDKDMVEWCNQGEIISEFLENRWLRAAFLGSKGFYLSQIWVKEDMQTAFTIKAGNMIGIQVISDQQLQQKINELHNLETQFLNTFKEAIDIGIELKNANLLAQILLNIGQAAGGRYIHLNALGVYDRANREKTLSKRTLLYAKELYSAIGYELGVGYAIHNLANQLYQFGEKKEAAELTKTAIEIAKKYRDNSLLQTAIWLEESLKTDHVPDYVHGERRERKK